MYYDKRIRYLSYYESGIKLQNAGYVKFQVRDSLCQMIVYMKGPRLMGSGEAKVYLLSERQEKKEDDLYAENRRNNVQKHPLGNLSIRNGQGHCAVRLNAEDMGGSGLRYDRICGIKIELHEYQYLESRWTVTNFMPARRGERESAGGGYRGIAERSGQNTAADPNMPEAPVEVSLFVTPVSENSRVEKLVREESAAGDLQENGPEDDCVRETREDTETERIAVEEFRMEAEKTSEETMPETEEVFPKEMKEMMPAETADNNAERTIPEEESMQEMLEREVRKDEAQKTEKSEAEYTLEEEILQGAEEARRLEAEEEVQILEQELQPDKWKQLRETYPVVHPIREDEEYLKIAPRDFVIFTEKYQQLVHNSFLLHGYYNYKHLILGRKEKEGKTVYYLGVPGTFHEREKKVAVMFGFEAFDGKREPAENGDFGYYLRRVEI